MNIQPITDAGVAVIVDGKIVAWFAEWNDDVQTWCAEHHLGKWLLWRASPPVTIPLTAEQQAMIRAEADRLTTLFKDRGEIC